MSDFQELQKIHLFQLDLVLQLSILTNDNKALIERLKNVKDGASVIICDGGDYDKKEQSAPKNDVNKLAQ